LESLERRAGDFSVCWVRLGFNPTKPGSTNC